MDIGTDSDNEIWDYTAASKPKKFVKLKTAKNEEAKKQINVAKPKVNRNSQSSSSSGSKESTSYHKTTGHLSDIDLDVIDVDADFVETSVVFKQNYSSFPKQSRLSQQNDGSMKYKARTTLPKRSGISNSRGKKSVKGGKIDNYFAKSPVKTTNKRKSWEMEEVVVSSSSDEGEEKSSKSSNVSDDISDKKKYMGINVKHCGNKTEKQFAVSPDKCSNLDSDDGAELCQKTLETTVVDVVIENEDEYPELFRSPNKLSSVTGNVEVTETKSCDDTIGSVKPRRSLHEEFNDSVESVKLDDLVDKSCDLLFQCDEQSNSAQCSDDYVGDGGFLKNDETVVDKSTGIDDRQSSSDTESIDLLVTDTELKTSITSDNSPSKGGSIIDLLSTARKQTSLTSFFKAKFTPSVSQTSKSVGKNGNAFFNMFSNRPAPNNSNNNSSRRGRGRGRGQGTTHSESANTTTDSEKRGGYNGKNRTCPFYKKIPETAITVDAFRYGVIPGCEAYVLTHFHYDHYGGLTKKFAQPLFCSPITGNLVEKRIGVDEKWINRLPMWKPCQVAGVTLTLMEANHCPGAVIILFELKNGKRILHTGDFRANTEMEGYDALVGAKIAELYLDTTYCNPSYAFPPQRDVIDFVVALVMKHMAEHPHTLIVCGAYTIGKERIFTAIAKVLDSKICVMSDKKKVLDCLDDPDLKSKVTLDWTKGKVHVLPMGKLKQEDLLNHLAKHSQFRSILAFQPTGWTHTDRTVSLSDIRPKWSKLGVTLYGVPYSEHSSYLELKRFVQFLQPLKILATVNNGNPAARQKMDAIFQEWMTEKL